MFLTAFSSFLLVAGEMGFAGFTLGDLELVGLTGTALVDRRVGAGDFFILEINQLSQKDVFKVMFLLSRLDCN